ncbi:MAG TPA: PAS domain S-box protein, partial [Gammaproteobacteria bacterium]
MGSLEIVVATAREPFLVLDENLQILIANQAFCRYFRLLPEEAENQPLYRLDNGGWNIPALRNLLERILPAQNRVEGFELKHDFSGIGQKTLSLNARCLRANDGKVALIFLAFEEVGRQQQAENEQAAQHVQELEKLNAQLREGERHYRELIQILPAAIYTCDARGRVTLYNEAAATLWGREPEIGKDLWCGSWRIYRPDGSPLPLEDCPMAVCIRESRAVRGERIVVERPDGVRVDVLPHPTPLFDSSGAMTGAINMLVDVSSQCQSHELQARLAAIVESSDDAIVSKDLKGVVQSWNTGAQRIFGYSAEEMIGQPITRIIPPHLQDEERHILGKLCRGERIDHYETVRVAKDGRRIDVSLSVSPVRDASGRIIGASKVARDITEQKRIANALLEADRRKNEFLAMLAHELRNPLDAISNAAHLLQMEDQQGRENGGLKIIDRQTRQLTRLIDELLDVSRITQGKIRLQKERLEVSAVIAQAVETVQPLIQARNHNLHVDYAQELL